MTGIVLNSQDSKHTENRILRPTLRSAYPVRPASIRLLPSPDSIGGDARSGWKRRGN